MRLRQIVPFAFDAALTWISRLDRNRNIPDPDPHASSAFLLSLDTSSDPLSTRNNLDKIVIGFNAPYAVMNTLAPKQ